MLCSSSSFVPWSHVLCGKPLPHAQPMSIRRKPHPPPHHCLPTCAWAGHRFCPDCRSGTAMCAVCGGQTVAGEGLVKCKYPTCGFFFHPSCLHPLNLKYKIGTKKCAKPHGTTCRSTCLAPRHAHVHCSGLVVNLPVAIDPVVASRHARRPACVRAVHLGRPPRACRSGCQNINKDPCSSHSRCPVSAAS